MDSRHHLVTISCHNFNQYLGLFVIVGDDIQLPGQSRYVDMTPKQWAVTKYQVHAMWSVNGSAWKPIHLNPEEAGPGKYWVRCGVVWIDPKTLATDEAPAHLVDGMSVPL